MEPLPEFSPNGLPLTRVARDEKVLVEKLVSLYRLLDQLGWFVASEDPHLPDTFVLRMRSFVKFGKPHISRIELDSYLFDIAPSNILCRTRSLIIWKEPPSLPRSPTIAPPLTCREKEVEELLLAGMTLPLIAADLGISQRTVEKHVQNLYRKRGVSSYNELVFGRREEPVPSANGQLRNQSCLQ